MTQTKELFFITGLIKYANGCEVHMIKAKTWRGEYKNIHYEICSHYLDHKEGPWWNTYIVLNTRYNKSYIDYLWSTKTKRYKRYNGKFHVYKIPNDLWDMLSWNGGHTFYEQKKEKDFQSIKIGDDYQHSWDYERGRRHLDEDWMQRRCEIMIDEFIDIMERQGISNELSKDVEAND